MGVERGWEIRGKENPVECRNSRYKGRAITFRADIEDSRKSLPKTPPTHTHTHPMAEIQTLFWRAQLEQEDPDGHLCSRTCWKSTLQNLLEIDPGVGVGGGKKAVQGMSQQRQFALKLHKAGVEGMVRGGGVGGHGGSY